jgi:hypothetical protein
MVVKKSGASRVVPVMMETPKKAWNAIVAKSTMSRSAGLHFGGPGSMPTSTQAKRYPAMRKWTVMTRCPVCVVSASSNRPVQ